MLDPTRAVISCGVAVTASLLVSCVTSATGTYAGKATSVVIDVPKGEQARAYDAALRALVMEGWHVEMWDRAAGVIQTDYKATGADPDSFIVQSCLGVGGSPTRQNFAERRLMLAVLIDEGSIELMPQAEICLNGCEDDARLTRPERAAFTDVISQFHRELGSPRTPSRAPVLSESRAPQPTATHTPVSTPATPVVTPAVPTIADHWCETGVRCEVDTFQGVTIAVEVGVRFAVRLRSGEVVFGQVVKARRSGIQLDAKFLGSTEISNAWRP